MVGAIKSFEVVSLKDTTSELTRGFVMCVSVFT